MIIRLDYIYVLLLTRKLRRRKKKEIQFTSQQHFQGTLLCNSQKIIVTDDLK